MKYAALTFFFCALARQAKAQTVSPSALFYPESSNVCSLTPVDETVCIELPPTSTSAKVDVFLLFDDTGSFSGFVGSLASTFNMLIPNLQATLPDADLAFGVGRFEDFISAGSSNQPYILNQPIVTNADAEDAGTTVAALISSALQRRAPGGGNDGPESAIEGLFQAATGLGYDHTTGVGNGNLTGVDGNRLAGSIITQLTLNGYEGDVPPFSTLDSSVIRSGSVGGAGWRSDAQKIIILATDICSSGEFDDVITSPFATVSGSVFSCRSNPPNAASVQQTIDALVNTGIQVIGLSASTRSFNFLEAVARLTNAVTETGAPQVYSISTSSSVLARAVTQAVESITVVPIDITAETDCNSLEGVNLEIEPRVVKSVPPGGEACFSFDVSTTNPMIDSECTIAFVNDASGQNLGTANVNFECASHGGVIGDPHILTWNQKSFDFHGECDLVLLHSDHVNGDRILDLHVRTEIQNDLYSSIVAAALQVGETTLEIDPYKFFLEGNEFGDEDLPLHTDEFVVKAPNFEPDKKYRRTYDIILKSGGVVHVIKTKSFLSITVDGKATAFEKSTGLLGDFYTGARKGRDGRVIASAIEYGQEWQVQPDEPKLFRTNRDPQLPYARCTIPAAASTHRRLRVASSSELHGLAKKACVGASEFDSCVHDILLSGDITFADAW